MSGLVERDRELAALDALLADHARGVAVIDGPLASGKTALLHAFAERATARGAAFVSAAASRTAHPLLLGMLDQIRHGVRALLRDDERAPDGGDEAEHMLTAVHQSLVSLAERQPVIIGIDDAHLADVGSLQCLITLIRLLTPFRVLFVFSGCLQSQQAHWLLRAEIARMPRRTSITLKPLSRNGIEQLVTSELGPVAARLLAADCYRASGGNPLLAHALVEDNRAHAEGHALVIGDAYGSAMLSCLYRSEPGVLELARTLAALGESASTPLLSRLLDIDPESTALAVDALNVAGLLRSHRFPHERARTAVLGSMAPSALRAIHGRAARLLHEDGAAPQAVARHLIAADSPQPWAVPVLEQAAEQQLVDGQTSAAVSCLRLARRACTDERQHAAITSALSNAVWQMDPAAATRYLPELTTAVRKGHLGGRHAGRLCGQLLWHGQPAEATDLLAGLTEETDASSALQRLDEVRLWLPLLYPGLNGHSQQSQQHQPAPEPHRLAASVLTAVLTGSADDAGLADLERLLGRTRLSGSTLIPIALSLMALCYAERFTEARSWCEAFLAENSANGVPLWTAILETVRAVVSLQQGELADAERLAHHALHLMSARSWGVAVGAPLSVLIAAATSMGTLEKAADYLSVPIPDATFHTLFGAHYLIARGRLHLANGHAHAALQNFESCGSLVVSWGFDCPAAFPWRANAAQARQGVTTVVPAPTATVNAEPPRAVLSDAERRVAVLAAAGHTNRQIAHKLYITVSTVEQHLTKIYRKLSVTRRADLRARLKHDAREVSVR